MLSLHPACWHIFDQWPKLFIKELDHCLIYNTNQHLYQLFALNMKRGSLFGPFEHGGNSGNEEVEQNQSNGGTGLLSQLDLFIFLRVTS